MHTHLHHHNPTGLLVYLQRQYNPTGLPVRSQGCTYNPTGLPVRSQGCTLTATANQDAPLNPSPPSSDFFMMMVTFITFKSSLVPLIEGLFILYILQETARQSVCAPGAGFNPPGIWSSCGQPLSCCLATSVVRFGGARVVFPQPGSLCFWET